MRSCSSLESRTEEVGPKNLYHTNVPEVFDEEVEAENEIAEMGSVEESENFETLKEHTYERLQLRYPFDQDVQQKMRNSIVPNLKI